MENKGIEIKATDAVAWIKKTVKGDDYLSVKITLPDGSFISERMFLNKKNNPAQPDYRMIKPKVTATPATSAPAGFDNDEQIPF